MTKKHLPPSVFWGGRSCVKASAPAVIAGIQLKPVSATAVGAKRLPPPAPGPQGAGARELPLGRNESLQAKFAKQNPHLPIQAARGLSALRSVIQKVDKSHSHSLTGHAFSFGVRSNAGELIDINACDRFSWYSDSALVEIAKSLGCSVHLEQTGKCPACGKTGVSEYELDHMNPWRQYIVFMMRPEDVDVKGDEIWIPKDLARALYNDPLNLWYICKGCNRKKSDKIIDTKKGLDNISSVVYDGDRGRKISLKNLL